MLIVFVLLGAPITASTFGMVGVHAATTALPLALAAGITGDSLVTFLLQSTWTRQQRTIVIPALACLLGSWMGALVIPLDWDQPWQPWPISSTYGCLAGGLAGSIVVMAVEVAHVLQRPDIGGAD